eukprot:6445626-Amphidinium_carterae.1
MLGLTHLLMLPGLIKTQISHGQAAQSRTFWLLVCSLLCTYLSSAGMQNLVLSSRLWHRIWASKKIPVLLLYEGGVFEELSWTQTSYVQTQMHPYDRYFYDPIADNFTVDKFLDDLTQ